MKKPIVFFLLFFSWSQLQAQKSAANKTEKENEAIETDRPDESETPFILSKKCIQFEFGVSKESFGNNVSEWTLPVLQVRYGLSKKVEALLISEYTNASSSGKFQDSTSVLKISPALRINLIEGRAIIPHTSVLLASGFNKFSSKKAIKVSSFSPEIRLAMSNKIKEGISIGYNLGAEWEDIEEKPEWAYTFTPEFEFSERWGGYVEIFGGLKEGENENNVDAGIQYKVNNNFAIDAFAGKGISKDNKNFFAGIGAAIRFCPKK